MLNLFYSRVIIYAVMKWPVSFFQFVLKCGLAFKRRKGKIFMYEKSRGYMVHK